MNKRLLFFLLLSISVGVAWAQKKPNIVTGVVIAADGVVLITTKQGRSGRITFDAEVKHGINARYLPQYDVITSPEEYMEIAYEAMKNSYERFGLKEQLERLYNSPKAEFKPGKTIADKPTTPGDLLYFSGILKGGEDAQGIWERYNIWKASPRELD